jgi:Ca2+-dependent lipid-binding protein
MLLLIILGLLAFGAYYILTSTPDVPVVMEKRKYETKLPTLPEQHDDGYNASNPRDNIARTVESVDWMNCITKALWPYVGKIVQSELGPTLEPLINAALPKPLKNFKFVSTHLGKDYLVLDRVTVHKRYKDSVALDLDVRFRGQPEITMKVSPLAGTFGIEELRWSGRMSVLMRPLTTSLPCIGAVQAAFVTHPELEIDFKGAAAFADFGPVERVVRKVLRDVLASMFVLPNRFMYKLLDSVDFFECYYPPSGALNVSILRGRGFQKEKKAGLIKLTPDCFCRFKFGLEKAITPVMKKSLSLRRT